MSHICKSSAFYTEFLEARRVFSAAVPATGAVLDYTEMVAQGLRHAQFVSMGHVSMAQVERASAGEQAPSAAPASSRAPATGATFAVAPIHRALVTLLSVETAVDDNVSPIESQ
ncbi:MAG: hypothetical protein NZ561_13295 [Phycisphaerae bacterium]|nr:hypothetical protein [Phycisphaerae bacterium]MDW8262011.1 hypothetical protein [Phycisphaerales bacterium]